MIFDCFVGVLWLIQLCSYERKGEGRKGGREEESIGREGYGGGGGSGGVWEYLVVFWVCSRTQDYLESIIGGGYMCVLFIFFSLGCFF